MKSRYKSDRLQLKRGSLPKNIERKVPKIFRFMYAIVEIAGQQFKVEAGRQIFVNRLAAEKGAEVEFATVLLIDNDGDVKVGAPYIEGAKVKATVLDDSCKGDKVLVFKKRRRKGYQKCNGHRQYLSKIQIEEIA